MTKYIPAVRVVDNHFKKVTYEIGWGTEPMEDYQSALTKATKNALQKEEDHRPITRLDGLTYPKQKYEPVVLKEVVMVEKDD